MGIEKTREVSCANCFSACCRKGMHFRLDQAEYGFMKAGGARLAVDDIAEFVDGPFENGVVAYILEEDCPYIGTHPDTGRPMCTVYNNPAKPEACSTYEVGEADCLHQRMKFDVVRRNTLRFERTGDEEYD